MSYVQISVAMRRIIARDLTDQLFLKIPEQYSWHDEPGDPQRDYANHLRLLDQYGAPNRTININVRSSISRSSTRPGCL